MLEQKLKQDGVFAACCFHMVVSRWQLDLDRPVFTVVWLTKLGTVKGSQPFGKHRSCCKYVSRVEVLCEACGRLCGDGVLSKHVVNSMGMLSEVKA